MVGAHGVFEIPTEVVSLPFQLLKGLRVVKTHTKCHFLLPSFISGLNLVANSELHGGRQEGTTGAGAVTNRYGCAELKQSPHGQFTQTRPQRTEHSGGNRPGRSAPSHSDQASLTEQPAHLGDRANRKSRYI